MGHQDGKQPGVPGPAGKLRELVFVWCRDSEVVQGFDKTKTPALGTEKDIRSQGR